MWRVSRTTARTILSPDCRAPDAPPDKQTHESTRKLLDTFSREGFWGHLRSPAAKFGQFWHKVLPLLAQIGPLLAMLWKHRLDVSQTSPTFAQCSWLAHEHPSNHVPGSMWCSNAFAISPWRRIIWRVVVRSCARKTSRAPRTICSAALEHVQFVGVGMLEQAF